MLESLYTSTKVVPNLSGINTMVFIPQWDAAWVNNGVMKVFRDGTSISMGTIGSNTNYIPLAGGGMALWNIFDNKITRLEQFTLQPIFTDRLTTYDVGFSPGYFPSFIDEERNLYFMSNYDGTVNSYHLDTGVYIKKVTICPAGGQFKFSWAGSGRFFAFTSTKIVIYDYVSETVLQESIIGSGFKCGTYDINTNTVMALNSTGHIQIFSLEDSGNTLSAPTFSPTGNKYMYSGYGLTTRLTGQNNVGISNKWINWELLNYKGVLEKSYSLTDVNGYARNYYWCPTDIALIGSETIRVWYEQ
jgi:hypothetical protein